MMQEQKEWLIPIRVSWCCASGEKKCIVCCSMLLVDEICCQQLHHLPPIQRKKDIIELFWSTIPSRFIIFQNSGIPWELFYIRLFSEMLWFMLLRQISMFSALYGPPLFEESPLMMMSLFKISFENSSYLTHRIFQTWNSLKMLLMDQLVLLEVYMTIIKTTIMCNIASYLLLWSRSPELW